jgi:5-hydroxyisourate hydrolase
VSAISTHVLDVADGCPAAGIRVRLERVAAQGPETRPAAEQIAEARTDADGRISALGPDVVAAGTYRLVFETAGYLVRRHGNSAGGTGTAPFFPEVTVTFTVARGEHCHVPLLLSPFGYSTYRGS